MESGIPMAGSPGSAGGSIRTNVLGHHRAGAAKHNCRTINSFAMSMATQSENTTAPHDRGSISGELSDSNGAPKTCNVDLPRIERAVKEILAAVGEDPNREGLRETPARV